MNTPEHHPDSLPLGADIGTKWRVQIQENVLVKY